MAFVLPFLPYIAAGIAAVGAVQQGNAAKSAADFNAKVAHANAENVNAQTTARQELVSERARQTIGDQLALGGQSGFELGGSRLDLLSQSLWNAEMDALNVRYEGDLKASGLNSQAKLDNFQGEQAQTAGYFSAASSLAGGAYSYTRRGGNIPTGS